MTKEEILSKRRIIILEPEIAGEHGPKIWVSATDADMQLVLKVLSIQGKAINTRAEHYDYQRCFELPFGFTETQIWANMIDRMKVLVKIKGEK